jgi:hypothetical protein
MLSGGAIMSKGSGKGGTGKRVHVISRGDSWAVKKEGNLKASKIYQDKQAAISDARKSGVDVVVHKKDGSIQKWEKHKK